MSGQKNRATVKFSSPETMPLLRSLSERSGKPVSVVVHELALYCGETYLTGIKEIEAAAAGAGASKAKELFGGLQAPTAHGEIEGGHDAVSATVEERATEAPA